MPRLFALTPMRRFMFRTISQTAIEYRDSALSSGAAEGIRAGDRLPGSPQTRAPGGRRRSTTRAAARARLAGARLRRRLGRSRRCAPRAGCRCTRSLARFDGRPGSRATPLFDPPDGYVGCAADGEVACSSAIWMPGRSARPRVNVGGPEDVCDALPSSASPARVGGVPDPRRAASAAHSRAACVCAAPTCMWWTAIFPTPATVIPGHEIVGR
jgi:hypothetical protein